MLGVGQLLLRMHTAFFQAGSPVVESSQPADRICVIVSGRSDPALFFYQPIPAVTYSVAHTLYSQISITASGTYAAMQT